MTKENTSSDTGVVTGPRLIVRESIEVPTLTGWALLLLTLVLLSTGCEVLRPSHLRNALEAKRLLLESAWAKVGEFLQA